MLFLTRELGNTFLPELFSLPKVLGKFLDKRLQDISLLRCAMHIFFFRKSFAEIIFCYVPKHPPSLPPQKQYNNKVRP